jgi:hypothetical protein
MKRHGPNASSPWPKVGARIGTMKKIICATDIVRAICRPEAPSRTMATASTRVEADISPWSSRAPSRAGKVAALAAKTLAPTKPASVPINTGRRPKRSASGP